MANLTFFTVTGIFTAVAGDNIYDSGADPDLVPITGSVRFTPMIGNADSLQADTLSPPTNLKLAPITARIKKGVVTSAGGAGVRLPANSSVLNIDGDLFYQVEFLDLVARGERLEIETFTLEAPATDVTVDLVDVARVAGSTVQGIIRGPRGLPVDDVQGALAGTAAQFYVEGTAIGDPLVLPSAAWNSIVGKPTAIGAGTSPADARAAIAAVSADDVVTILADDTAPAAAAAAAATTAVDTYVTGLDLVQGTDVRLPTVNPSAEIAWAVTDATSAENMPLYVDSDGATHAGDLRADSSTITGLTAGTVSVGGAAFTSVNAENVVLSIVDDTVDERVAFQVNADGSAVVGGVYLSSLSDAHHTMNSFLYNFDSSNLLKWRKALGGVRNGTADAKLLCVGDSTTTGIGDSSAATVPQNKAWPAQLAALMNSYFVPAAKGLGVPKSSSTSQAADTRWSGAGGWALGGYSTATEIGWGNKSTYWWTSTSTSVLTFTDGVSANTYDVYYVDEGGAVFTIAATGGAPVTVTPVGGGVVRKATCTASAVGTGNSVTVTAGTGGTGRVFIVGVEPSNSTVKQVRIGNAGASGSDSGGWVSYPLGVTTNYYGSLDCIKAYAPNLTVIDLGINDAANNFTVAKYAADMAAIIAAAQVSGDVILKTMLPSNPAASPSAVPFEDMYVPYLKTLGLPVIDVYGRIGSYTPYNAAGFMSDDKHGNDYAYSDVASMVFTALRAA